MSLGERLRLAREKKELTQVAVFKKIGIHNKTLSGYENNVASPDPESLKDLALLYDVSSDYLLGITNEMLPVHKTKSAEVLNIYSKDERNLVLNYRELSNNSQVRILERLETLLEIEKPAKTNKNNSLK